MPMSAEVFAGFQAMIEKSSAASGMLLSIPGVRLGGRRSKDGPLSNVAEGGA